MKERVVYKTSCYGKQNIGLIFETLKDAEMFIESNFPNAEKQCQSNGKLICLKSFI